MTYKLKEIRITINLYVCITVSSMVSYVSVTLSFRIPKEIKKRMDKLRGTINWSKEVRRFIEKLVKEYEQIKAIEELEKHIESIPTSPRGTAAKYVRMDRDSH